MKAIRNSLILNKKKRITYWHKYCFIANMYPLTNINFDVMDDVELGTACHPASVGYTDGTYINVVTRSGGNQFSGRAFLYYTSEGMNQYLWPDEEISAFGMSKPEVDKLNFNGSVILGGPIIKDKLWFFSNIRYIQTDKKTNFIPFTDVRGVSHETYDWIHKETMKFIKITVQITPELKIMAMFNYMGPLPLHVRGVRLKDHFSGNQSLGS